eukprot:m.95533 g.95533  ORF g.95533 m.95533 type:complete len:307 (+) comp21927_c0_seq2:1558-2478(+)
MDQNELRSTKHIPPSRATISWYHLDKTKFYVFGPIAGLATRLILYPTNLVKTRLQLQQSLYSNTLNAFSQIIRHEGFGALYKGFLPNCSGIFAQQCYVTALELTLHNLKEATPNDHVRYLLAGGAASIASQVVVVPFDIICQRLQIANQSAALGLTPASAEVERNTRDVVRSILNKEGPKGFYRGFWTSVLTYTPSSAVWWATYGFVRDHQHHAGLGSNVPNQAAAGAMAGIVAAFTTNPVDVIRTRLQVYGSTFSQTLKELVTKEGWRALGNGSVARALYMAPSSALIITSYELVKRLSLKDGIE